MNSQPSRPEFETRVGPIRVTVWSNQRQTSSGRSFGSRKVLMERLYRDSQGTAKTTAGLETNDIPKAILALNKAYEYLTTSDGTRRDAEKNPNRGAGHGPGIP